MMLVVAAGRGSRAGEGLPKQYRRIGGEMVLTRTLRAALGSAEIEAALVVIHPDDATLFEAAVAPLPDAVRARILPPVGGGATRAASVSLGLAAIEGADDMLVGVHDGARPFLTPELTARVFAAAEEAGAAIPATPVTDTIKQVDGGHVQATPDRGRLSAVQTPQVFRFGLLRAAYAELGGAEASDDASVVERFGHAVTVVAGDPGNVKLTTQADFDMAEQKLSRALVTRVGTGYDVHAFTEGDHVTLCGHRIPHARGVLAHSDGDVAYHALCDAIFGALGEGDIGQHFPPSDARWKGAASAAFLRFACQRITARGGRLDHVDISIVCEAPRIGPHRAAMLARIMTDTGLSERRIGLKATTSERLGFTGRGEGLAALATATLRLPEDER